MKVKNSFITNSSSCSFVLIGREITNEIKNIEELKELSKNTNLKIITSDGVIDFCDEFIFENIKKYNYKIFDTYFYRRIYDNGECEHGKTPLNLPNNDYVIIIGTEQC